MKIIEVVVVVLPVTNEKQYLQCIQLTLDVTPTQGKRPSCGVLICVEESQGSAISQLRDTISSISLARNITKMTVYKTNGLGAEGITDEAILVASVDAQQPRVMRVANAMKVDGRLESSVTTIRVELFKQEDCRAGFTCEVLAVDASDREVVKTSHLLRQPSTPVSVGTSQQGWTPAVAMHLVSLVQELNTNMELMRSHMDGYNDRLSGVEDKVGTLDKDFTTLIIAQEKKFGDKINLSEKELRDKLDLFENRFTDKFAAFERKLYKLSVSNEGIEDKLDSSSKRLEDKLGEQEDKISSSVTKLQNVISEIETVQPSFTRLVQNFGDQLKQKLENLYMNSLNLLNISKVSDDFQQFKVSIESVMEQSLRSLKGELMTHDSVLTNQLEKAFEKATLNVTMGIAAIVNDQYSLLDKNSQEIVKEVVHSINESAIETRSSLKEIVGSMNITKASDVASKVTEILTPRTCKKGMISLLTQSSYPYPVVKPSSDDSLAVPYLCDTVTDGGGWIIIQRRSTGNVDFYRNWADYKRGFGTLDDDFWLGNDNIHAITSSGDYELRVDLRYNGKSAYAHYGKFSIADEQNKYALNLGPYHGTAGDALSGHTAMPFTTRDRDNDSYGHNCAVVFTGAWWYGACHSSNLNGKWKDGGNKGPRWSTFSSDKAVSFSEMKIRRID
ncbi:fibrinogen-related protein 3-2 [Elysia marginata]|uniref:Fibrinogen-related protein 3-2 n=1 Tax=Elysia marginata TaxID=1093978 RepID=A0AAV4FFU2_9GAST|nr:fibrinogen-related protein 3-2 [Elysia marginata]